MSVGCFRLSLEVHNAAGLSKGDTFRGCSDPYCVIMLDRRRIGATSVVRRSLNPVWNQSLSCDVLNINGTLKFRVYHNRMGRDLSLGFGKVDLRTFGVGNGAKRMKLVLQRAQIEEGTSASGVIEVSIELQRAEGIFEVVHAPMDAQTLASGFIDISRREKIATRLLKPRATTDLFDQEFVRTPLFRQDIFKTDLALDVLDDCAGLTITEEHNDCSHHLLRYSADFTHSTCLEFASGHGYATYPIVEGTDLDKCTYHIILGCTSHSVRMEFSNVFAYWSFIMRLTAAQKKWSKAFAGEEDDFVDPDTPAPVGGWLESFMPSCRLTITPLVSDNASPDINSGIASIGEALGERAKVRCSVRSEEAFVLTVTAKEGRCVSIPLHGLSIVVLSADYSQPHEIDIKIELLNGKVALDETASARRLVVQRPEGPSEKDATAKSEPDVVFRLKRRHDGLTFHSETKKPDDDIEEYETAAESPEVLSPTNVVEREVDAPEPSQVVRSRTLTADSNYSTDGEENSRLNMRSRSQTLTSEVADDDDDDGDGDDGDDRDAKVLVSFEPAFDHMLLMCDTYSPSSRRQKGGLLSTVGNALTDVSNNTLGLVGQAIQENLGVNFGVSQTSKKSEIMPGVFVTLKGAKTVPYVTKRKGGRTPSWNETVNISVPATHMTGSTLGEITLRMWDASSYVNGLATLIGEKTIPLRSLFEGAPRIDAAVSALKQGNGKIDSGSKALRKTAFVTSHDLNERSSVTVTLLELTDLYPSLGGGGGVNGGSARSVYARARLVRQNGDSDSVWKCGKVSQGDFYILSWPRAGDDAVVFTFSAADGLDWADFICIDILDVTYAQGIVDINNAMGIASVGEEEVARAYIPLHDIQVEHRELEYSLSPRNCARVDRGARASDVATLLISCRRTIVQVPPDSLVPNLVVKTLFSESTVYNTYWPASVVVSGALVQVNEADSEELLAFPSHGSLILIDRHKTNRTGVPYDAFVKEDVNVLKKGAVISLVVIIYENETRKSAFHQWRPSRVSRMHFTDETGAHVFPCDTRKQAPLPQGWEWADDWTLDREYTRSDEEGWSYGLTFENMMAAYRRRQSVTSHENVRGTRRRRWTRTLRRIKRAGKQGSGSAMQDSECVTLESRASVHDKFGNGVVRLCRERGNDIFGPVNIPWSQVSRTDVVTPSVLALQCSIGRYVGGELGTERYADIEVVVFVKGCSAFLLKGLVDERSQLHGTRQGIKQILAEACMSHSSFSHEMSPASELVRDLDDTVHALQEELSALLVTEEARHVQVFGDSKRDERAVELQQEEISFASDTDNTCKLGGVFTTDIMTKSMEEGVAIDAIVEESSVVVTKAADELVSSFSSSNRGKSGKSPVSSVRMQLQSSLKSYRLGSSNRAHSISGKHTHLASARQGSTQIRAPKEPSTADEHDMLLGPGQLRAEAMHSRLLTELYARPVEENTRAVPSALKMQALRTMGFYDEYSDEHWTGGVLSVSEYYRKVYLARGITRLHMYICVLLGFGLQGAHSFHVDEVMGICEFDIAKAKSIAQCHNDPGSSFSVDGTSEAIFHLLAMAETRMRDTILCGWYHRGGELEACLKVMVNEYYTNIVGELGRFFDLEGLEAVKGIESKIKLINFIIEKDRQLAATQRQALRPFHLTVEPAPVLSMSLDFARLISWYGGIVREEMRSYITNTVDVWQTTARQAREDGSAAFPETPLPWEPVRIRGEEGPYMSMIPEDCMAALNQYVLFARPRPKSLGATCHELLASLDEALSVALVGAICYLANIEMDVVAANDWTLPLSKQLDNGKEKRRSLLSSFSLSISFGRGARNSRTTSKKSSRSHAQMRSRGNGAGLSEEDEAKLDDNIAFLAALANDCVRLLSQRSIEGFIEKLLGARTEKSPHNGGTLGTFAIDLALGGDALLCDGGSSESVIAARAQHEALAAYQALGKLCTQTLHALSQMVFAGDSVTKAVFGTNEGSPSKAQTKSRRSTLHAFLNIDTKGSNNQYNFRSTWMEAVRGGSITAHQAAMTAATDELHYMADQLGTPAYVQLLFICADKVALMFHALLVAQTEAQEKSSDDVMDLELCTAFSEQLRAAESTFRDILQNIPEHSRRAAWQSMEQTFRPLRKACEMLTSPLQAATLVLSIQEISEASEALGLVDAIALSRMCTAVVAIRLKRDEAECIATTTAAAKRVATENDEEEDEDLLGELAEPDEEKKLLRMAAETMTLSCTRTIVSSADARCTNTARESRTLEVEPTRAILQPSLSLLRAAYGPLTLPDWARRGDLKEEAIDALCAFEPNDSPAFALTISELLTSSADHCTELLKDFEKRQLEATADKNNHGTSDKSVFVKRTSWLGSDVPTPNAKGSPSRLSPSSTSATTPSCSLTSSDSFSRTVVAPQQAGPLSARAVVVYGIVATNLPHLRTATASALRACVALVSTMKRHVDLDELEWAACSSREVASDLRRISWSQEDAFHITLPDFATSLESLDLIIGIISEARLYGSSTLLCHVRVNMGFLSLSSIDGLRIPAELNATKRSVAAAVAKENKLDPSYLQDCAIIVSINTTS